MVQYPIVQKAMSIRTKLYLLILPLVLTIVLLSGVLSSLASRRALTPVAARHLAYKAEQLRDFALSEWRTIVDLGLDDDAQIRAAAEESFQSYATSLLRTDTELIVAVDRREGLILEIGTRLPLEVMDPREEAGVYGRLEPGWFTEELLGEDRVGVVFALEPFDWKVAVTELEAVFFTDTQTIFRTHIFISLAAVVAATVLIWFFVGYVLRPVERLTDTVRRISTTGDLSQRVRIEFADEVGLLGHGFNGMIQSLEETIQSERTARELAVSREEETLLLLGRASEFRDQETGEHLARIGALSALFFQLMGRDAEQQLMLRRSSALHDVGKIGIPDRILLKPGKLTEDEFETMKRHTIIGHELLKDSRSISLRRGAEIALTHHERWDGSGYPAGLSGTEIPLEGRVVSVVDVFDALTSVRPYKRAWSPDDARDHILAERSKHFDPVLVDLFLEHFRDFRVLIER